MISGAFMVPHPPLIIPEVGRGKERKIQDTIDAYHEVGIKIYAVLVFILYYLLPQ